MWKDPYPEKQHQAIKALFDKLNEEALRGFPFLGGLRLRYDIAPPKAEGLRNQFRRELLEI